MRLAPLMLLALACGQGADPDKPGNNNNNSRDEDGDGFAARDDCDDADPLVNPDAEDLVGDEVDNNCDGVDGVDEDGDGAASIDSGGLDCDDTDPQVQGEDADNDGSPSCVDCDDANSGLSHLVEELCDGIDNDCSGVPDVDWDGVGACSQEFVASNQVDVLMVVDNSCSMFEEQLALSQASAALFDSFVATAVDYHIGVVSTDMNDSSQSGKLRGAAGVRWVDSATPNPAEVMSSMIEMGTGGSATEKGRDAAFAALDSLAGPGGYNEGFRRSDADLAMIVVADESDFSTTVGLTEFRDYLALSTPVDRRARVHAIVTPPALCPTASTPGDDYLWLVAQTGGLSDSICDVVWFDMLEAIAYDYEPHHLGVFELGLAIDPATLSVDVTHPGGTDVLSASEVTWDATEQTVTLPNVPPLFSEVTIWYAPL